MYSPLFRHKAKMSTILLVLLFSLIDFKGVSAKTIVYQGFPVAKTVTKKQVKAALVVPKAVQKAEAHLIIPSLKVNAVIKDMGVTLAGAMAIPNNRFDVGWFSSGTRPGLTGSAVIGGHNFWSGAGVFQHLDQLKAGDVLSVIDAKGVTKNFVVREMRTFDATDPDSGIFVSESGIHLNLITCSGAWDTATKSYATRLVIYTDLQ